LAQEAAFAQTCSYLISSYAMLVCLKSCERKKEWDCEEEEEKLGWRTPLLRSRRPPNHDSDCKDDLVRNDGKVEIAGQSSNTLTQVASGGQPTVYVESQTRLVWRDRTRQFKATRSALLAASANAVQRPTELVSVTEAHVAETELAAIHSEASQAHTSVAAKIVQHNGLRQFCEENRNRAPPFEFRVELPNLEASISLLLSTLVALKARLYALKVPDAGICQQVRDNVATYVSEAHETYQTIFAMQRGQLEELATQSRVFSPHMASISPGLHRRLAERKVSDSKGSPTLSMATTASPQLSGTSSFPTSAKSAARLPLDLYDSDDGEDDEYVLRSSPPFDSLFSPAVVTKATPAFHGP